MSTDHRRPRPPASCGLGPPEDFLSILLLRFELAYDFPPWIVPPTAVVYALFRCRPSSCRKNSPARLKSACDPAGAIEPHLHVVRHRGRLRDGLARLAQTLDVQHDGLAN